MNQRKKQAAELLGHQRVPLPVVLYNPSSDCTSHMHTNEKSVWHIHSSSIAED